MAKRARMITADDVLDELELAEDNDDFDEPMMSGSDDEFSDCELEDEDLEDDDSDGISDNQSTPPSPTSTPTLPADWSTNLTSLTMSDFNSSVGPTVPVPEKASEVFDLMFTPSLVDMIVEQSNLYAKQVMGEEKYTSWEKNHRGGAQGVLRFLHTHGSYSPSSTRRLLEHRPHSPLLPNSRQDIQGSLSGDFTLPPLCGQHHSSGTGISRIRSSGKGATSD
jgi:hypothetical protein